MSTYTIQQAVGGDVPPLLADTLEWQTSGGGGAYYSTLQELYNQGSTLAAAAAAAGADKIFTTQSGVAKAQTVTALGTAFSLGGPVQLGYSGTGSGAAHQFATATNANAAPTFAQPAFTDLSGSISSAQLNPVGAGTLSAPGLQVGEAVTGLVGQLGTHTLSLVANQIEGIRVETVSSGTAYFDFTPGLAGTPAALTLPAQAAAAATLAGIGFSFIADSAVAGTTTAGAQPGGDWTFTCGAAAQHTSGNARGGSFFVIPGAAVGTGALGVFGLGGKTSSFPGLTPRTGSGQWQVTDAARSGRQTIWTGSLGIGGTMDNYSANDVYLSQTGGAGTPMRMHANAALGWASHASDASQGADTSLSRKGAGIVGVGNGTHGDVTGQIQCASSTTGSGTATFTSTNCPAVTTTSTYCWILMTAQDGSQVYVPAWK